MMCRLKVPARPGWISDGGQHRFTFASASEVPCSLAHESVFGIMLFNVWNHRSRIKNFEEIER